MYPRFGTAVLEKINTLQNTKCHVKNDNNNGNNLCFSSEDNAFMFSRNLLRKEVFVLSTKRDFQV